MSRQLTTLPREDGFRMPAEWSEHKQTWMLWPQRTDNWRLGAKPAQDAFCKVIQAIADFEPVSVGVSAEQYFNASHRIRRLSTKHNVRLVELSTNDAWCRDTGPTFVRNNAGELRGIDWTFNAWGGLHGGLYFPWDLDNQVASKILSIEKFPSYRTEDFVLEGGSIHVDGEGTLLTTEECLLNRNRNPHLTRSEIEQKLKEYLGVEKILWLSEGVYEDETDGHIDNMACFIRPGEVLLAWTDDATDPQYARSRAAWDYLQTTTDAQGRSLMVHKLPLPAPIFATEAEADSVDPSHHCKPRMAGSRLAASYVNFYFCNGGVILPTFDDPADEQAANILSALLPSHRVVTIPGREILLGGGNVHCITQQQPL